MEKKKVIKWTRRPKIDYQRPKPDYAHQRRQWLRKPTPSEEYPYDPHRTQCYYGHQHSNVTQWLEKVTPSHAFNPTIMNQGVPFFNRKRTSITAMHATVVPDRRPISAPDPWYGRTATDISEHLRFIPPAHYGKALDKPVPYHGSKSTLVTNCQRQPRNPPLPSVIYHWWEDRPKSAGLAVPPQYVSATDLYAALPRRTSKTPQPVIPFSTAEFERPAPKSTRSPRSSGGTPRSVLDIRDVKSIASSARSGAVTPRLPVSITTQRPVTAPSSMQTPKSSPGGSSKPVESPPLTRKDDSAHGSPQSASSKEKSLPPKSPSGMASPPSPAVAQLSPKTPPRSESTQTKTPPPIKLPPLDPTLDVYRQISPNSVATNSVWSERLYPKERAKDGTKRKSSRGGSDR